MTSKISRPGVRAGYDLWSATYDATPNPLVALDRRYTLDVLAPQPREAILDAGCGTGASLRALRCRGALPVGVDFSLGMLRVAQRDNPGVGLVQGDLNRALPVRRGVFDAVLCTLVSEHLTDLQRFFSDAFGALRRGGRMVFSAFHPELAAAGVEANFQRDGVEYRLGAEPHRTEDFLQHMQDAGFRDLRCRDYRGDDELAAHVPGAGKYLGRPMLLVIEATR